MPVITGRFAEGRLYLRYCVSLLHPGRILPTFADPTPYTGNLDHHQEADLALLIEEGRRQLDRQAADLDRIRNRAGALATVSLALISAAVAKSADVLTHPLGPRGRLGDLVRPGSAGGRRGGRGTGGTSRLRPHGHPPGGPRPAPHPEILASGYIEQVSTGEETVRTFLTVFRDAVTLTVTSALIFLIVLACTLHGTTRSDRTERPCPTSTTCSQPAHPK
jgi:hypothetical protein